MACSNVIVVIQEDRFENSVFKMSFILFKPQCTKYNAMCVFLSLNNRTALHMLNFVLAVSDVTPGTMKILL